MKPDSRPSTTFTCLRGSYWRHNTNISWCYSVLYGCLPATHISSLLNLAAAGTLMAFK